ncbi:hypothetical protein TNCV_778681 [Trichonephila clavipes]|nr:hypothetical protein TNCV_778681 [Trichonephila clavipes]
MVLIHLPTPLITKRTHCKLANPIGQMAPTRSKLASLRLYSTRGYQNTPLPEVSRQATTRVFIVKGHVFVTVSSYKNTPLAVSVTVC